jgi:hypothetical protein
MEREGASRKEIRSLVRTARTTRGAEDSEGERVRRSNVSLKVTSTLGPWVSARRFSTRRKAFSDHRSSSLHRRGDTKSSVRGFSGCSPCALERARRTTPQRIGRKRVRLGRACERQRERQRSKRSGECSSRSEKDRGEYASSALKRRRSRGAPQRSRPKLTTANSFVDPPPSWPREWPGSR